ncbi:MAG: hypothetical protein QF921_06645 [Pseudomonadales bacterium]|jgi:hypothetical protein|nr:hypothetical protein [Pseudomonadales bacterium]MDP6469516.1 hypothetical protein [Pseudomonadales bacterium]MDP6827357.1 hypothetical protein [Pseudomonadales bacterium]MDP6971180.1 hypothetical protein [Pseudomonadales bacterium]|tara:strand:- start:725 stop:922 length:198 start_codon:yes stop_codon:yes gene_type:complete
MEYLINFNHMEGVWKGLTDEERNRHTETPGAARPLPDRLQRAAAHHRVQPLIVCRFIDCAGGAFP